MNKEDLDELNETFSAMAFTTDPEEVNVLILLNLIELKKEISKLNLTHKSSMASIQCDVANNMRNISAEVEMHFHRIR